MPVQHTPDDMRSCFCPECPTYRGGESVLYCAMGVSKQSFKPLGCLCPECPVFVKSGLHYPYFCLKGKHKLRHLG